MVEFNNISFGNLLAWIDSEKNKNTILIANRRSRGKSTLRREGYLSAFKLFQLKINDLIEETEQKSNIKNFGAVKEGALWRVTAQGPSNPEPVFIGNVPFAANLKDVIKKQKEAGYIKLFFALVDA